MDRSFFSIYGSDRVDGETRIALVLDDEGQPEYLHGAAASSSGRFARVIRGFMGGGKLPKPVAVKIERDELPTSVGAAKFLSEYQAQQDVHRDLADGERTRVVRMFEMWKLNPDKHCDDIPPILICPVSRQILAPRCQCGQVLRDDGLCSRRCPKPTEDDLLKSSACEPCRNAGKTCRAYWLNRRTCKMLVLEQLDMSLGDYVSWRWHGEKATDRAAWTKFANEHRPALEERIRQQGSTRERLTTEYAELEFLLAIFNDAMCGVQEMHDKGIPHLDLKPANFCLLLEGPAARLKVIDLGQADSPNLPWLIRQRSLNDDATKRLRDMVYSAPEQLPDRIRVVECPWSPTSKGCQLDVSGDPRLDVLPGDWCYLATPGGDAQFHRIVARRENKGRWIVSAWRIEPNDVWPSQMDDEDPPSTWQSAVSVGFVQSAGKSADIFALGMVLLFLATRGRMDLSAIRNNLPRLTGQFAELGRAKSSQKRPARQLGDALLARVLNVLAPLSEQVRNCPPQLNEVMNEILGIAFQAIFRGVRGASYSEHRNDCPPDAMKRLMGDIAAVRRRLRVLVRAHELHEGRIAEQRRNGLARLRIWLNDQRNLDPQAPPPPYSRERLCETFDFIGSEFDRNHREFEYLLDRYRRNADSLEKDLDLFERELEAKQVSVDRIHPVVEKVLRLLSQDFDPEEFAPPVRSAIIAAQGRLSKLEESLSEPLDDIVLSLREIDPKTGTLAWTDQDADAFQHITNLLQTTNEWLQPDVRQMANCLRQLHEQQERPLEEWLRLNDAKSWQEFGHSLRARLMDRKASSDKWLETSKSTMKYIKKLQEQLDITINHPWPGIRLAYRRSFKGIWLRIVAWLQSKPFETPLPVATFDSERLRQLVNKVRSGIREVRAIPSVGPVGESLLAESDRPRVAVSSKAQEIS